MIMILEIDHSPYIVHIDVDNEKRFNQHDLELTNKRKQFSKKIRNGNETKMEIFNYLFLDQNIFI